MGEVFRFYPQLPNITLLPYVTVINTLQIRTMEGERKLDREIAWENVLYSKESVQATFVEEVIKVSR